MHISRFIFWTLTISLLAPAISMADAPAPVPVPAGGPDRSGGDHPPTALYAFEGNGGLATDVALNGTTGTFELSGIPADGIVDRAYFITSTWDSAGAPEHSIELTFAGTAYGTIEVTSFDASPEELVELAGYAVDVTTDVAGNGSYGFDFITNQGGTGTFGSLLVVVYQAPSAPARAIVVNYGAESLKEDSSTSLLSGANPGEAVLHIFTEADNVGFSDGEESIAFNGSVILGGLGADIFNENQGEWASYFELPVMALAGENTVTLTTGEDFLGWHFAALVTPLTTTPAEQTSWGGLKSKFR